MGPLDLGAGSELTLRAALHRTLGCAGGAELVDHAGDVLHPVVHHGLDVVHVEQVQALHSPLQGVDLAASDTQAGRHPFQFDLRPKEIEEDREKYQKSYLTSKIGKLNSMGCTH